MKILAEGAVALGFRANTWQDSVVKAGELLVANGYATKLYIEGMVRTATELGPYIVMTPGIAIPHSRPEDGVLKVGLAGVKLAEPVEFGNKDNDPVYFVLAFCTPDANSHIEMLSTIAEILEQENILDLIKAAETKEELLGIFNKP